MRTRRSVLRSKTMRAHDGFIAGDGPEIYYKTLGRGTPLVVLHGGPGADHTDFLPALQPLAEHCKVVLIDQRGSGRSARLVDPAGYTLDALVKDLERVRRHLELPRFVLLGHSFGGILAQAYAVRHPRRLAGLVLAGTASSARRVDTDFRRIRAGLTAGLRARLLRHEKAGIFRANGTYEPAYAAASARAIAPYMYARKSAAPRTPAAPLGMEILREMWVRRSDFRIDGNLKGFDFTAALRRVKAPSLVVIGARDLVSTTTAEITRASLPRASLVVMADCAHMMFIDQPVRFNHLLTGFLSQCVSSKGKRS